MRALSTALLLSALGAACAAPDKQERYRAARLGPADPAQNDLIRNVELFFASGGQDYDQAVAKCLEHEATAQKLAMIMVVHMRDAEVRQRAAQGTDLQLRSLEENLRYTRARATLCEIGPRAVPTLEEALRHPHTDKRTFGVSVLSAMGPETIPAIKQGFADSPERFRRHYVEAVAGMKPGREVETALLDWSRDEDFRVRAAALTGLLRFGDRHLPMLRKIVIEDPDPFVQRQLVKGMAELHDRATAAAVVQFYEACSKRGDRRGITEAERTLVKMAKKPAGRGRRVIHYGLAHWQKWVLTLPVDRPSEGGQAAKPGDKPKNQDRGN